MAEIVVKLVETESELEGAINVRMRVFVVEQQIPVEEEIDDADAAATHAISLCQGQVVGTGRMLYLDGGMVQIGRMAVDRQFRPLHDRLGIPVQNSWVNADGTEFVWVRQFNSIEEIPIKEAEYFASPERTALADRPTSHIAKMEVRVIEAVAATAGVA